MKKEYDLSLSTGEAKRPLVLGDLLSVETLLRLNPHWIIENVEEDGDHFSASLKDYVTDVSFSLSGTRVISEQNSITLTMDHEKYQAIDIYITDGSLVASVTYPCVEEELIEEDERYVVLWLRSVKEYLRMYLKDTMYARMSRYIMNKVTLTMTPSQRKISLMLIRFSAVEIIVIILIVIGYAIFVLK